MFVMLFADEELLAWAGDAFVCGADISYVTEMESKGSVFKTAE